MMHISIRPATPEDLESVVVIYNQAIAAGQKTADTEPVSIDDRRDWLDAHPRDKYPIIVAEENGTVIGYLSISAYRPGRGALRHTAEVSYYVHFEHHRRGVASALLKHAIKLCPSLDIKNLFTILIESNEASIGLLEKHGFEKWGYMPRVAEYAGTEVGQVYYGLRIDEYKSGRDG